MMSNKKLMEFFIHSYNFLQKIISLSHNLTSVYKLRAEKKWFYVERKINVLCGKFYKFETDLLKLYIHRFKLGTQPSHPS